MNLAEIVFLPDALGVTTKETRASSSGKTDLKYINRYKYLSLFLFIQFIYFFSGSLNVRKFSGPSIKNTPIFK